jgi:SAM-dependent methyltransferase
MNAQETIDHSNSEFWNELCGSRLTRRLGITARDDASIARFDAAYLATYPYLLRRVPIARFAGLRVLEVGRGYGTLRQRIAQNCGEYTGFDIAAGPVDMMNHRLARLPRAAGRAQQGSILHCPFPNESFDAGVAIGCYHHTGNLQRPSTKPTAS